jgi:hypothetical protein
MSDEKLQNTLTRCIVDRHPGGSPEGGGLLR